jgi:dihydroorotase
MDRLLIKNGRIIDPTEKRDEIVDLLIENGKIVNLQRDIGFADAQVIDAKGKVLVPGLMDMHVHLREPGYEAKETIYSGTKSASAGGFVAVACMPNTNPICDNAVVIQKILEKAEKAGFAKVYPIAAITKGSLGKELTDIEGLVEAGAVAISDDGRTVMDSGVMRRAMEKAAEIGVPVISHCEDMNLAPKGVMNEGQFSEKFRLPGIPNAVENIIIARDIMLAELTGAHLHIAHLSTKEGVELVRQAKKRGANVTAETTPHHFTLTEDGINPKDANFKMNPPLRSKEDVEAIKKGLTDGTIDVIASDHAPHTREEKSRSFLDAPFGMIGLETIVGLVLTELVSKKILSFSQAIEKMTLMPYKILNLECPRLEKGAVANLTIIDLEKEWSVEPEKFYSKSVNTPFGNFKLKGKSSLTIVEGKPIKI